MSFPPGFEKMVECDIRESAVYVLYLELEGDRTIRVGALGDIRFKAGFYAYVGSARRGLWGRVRRHMEKTSTRHWHIDYLVPHCGQRRILWAPYRSGLECETAALISSAGTPIRGFGSSDCRCPSHLIHVGRSYGDEDCIHLEKHQEGPKDYQHQSAALQQG